MIVALLAPGGRVSAFIWAAIVGVVSFLIGGALVNPYLPWFSLTAVAGAAFGAFIVRGRLEMGLDSSRSVLKTGGAMVIFGISWGILAALVSTPVVVHLFGGVTGSGTTLVTAFLIKAGEQMAKAVLLTGLAAEPIDKTLQLLLAWLAARATPKAFTERLSGSV
jgi:energy-coupling factor transport system substrate-specific component